MTNLQSTGGNLTVTGKKQVATAWYDRGKRFIGSAILLKQKSGDSYVFLHLLCQGIEIILKALLLVSDYDKFQPMLRRPLGHDLIKILEECKSQFGFENIDVGTLEELKELNSYYTQHLLRYGSVVDLLVDPSTFKYMKVEKALRAVIKRGDKYVKNKIAS